MEHQLLARFDRRFRLARDHQVVPFRQFHALGDGALHVAREIVEVAVVDIGRDGLDPLAALVQDLVAPRSHRYVRHVAQAHQRPVGRPQRQHLDLRGRAALPGRQHDDDVDRAIALLHLPHARAFESALDRIQHLSRCETQRGEPFMPQPHGELRRARRRLHLDIARTLHRCDGGGHFLGVLVEQVEVGTEQVHHHGRREARDGFLDALGEEGVHRERHARIRPAIAFEDSADLTQDARLFRAFEGTHFHLELAVVGAERVGAVL